MSKKAPAAENFIPPELMGDFEEVHEKKAETAEKKAAEPAGEDFIPPELMGDMGAVVAAQKK